ncbi:MAG: hypothetical protein N2203_00855 [Bacteroidia bacterium]|nr:hypothetical protein [Bacteroidia bacterium]
MRKAKVLTNILLLTTTLFTSKINAQVFSKGSGILNLGIGLGGYVRYWGHGYSSTPYFNAAFDYGVYQFENEQKLSVGVGGFIGYKSVWYEWITTWRDKNGNWHIDQPVKSTWTYTYIGFRPSLNYSFNDKAMVYSALNIGYSILNHRYSDPTYYSSTSYGSSLGWGLLVGGRYFFSNSFAVFGEIGWGMSYLNLGVSFKLVK